MTSTMQQRTETNKANRKATVSVSWRHKVCPFLFMYIMIVCACYFDPKTRASSRNTPTASAGAGADVLTTLLNIAVIDPLGGIGMFTIEVCGYLVCMLTIMSPVIIVLLLICETAKTG